MNQPPAAADTLLGSKGQRVLSALIAAVAEETDSVSDELHAAICEYVGVLKSEGLKSEQAVMILNHAMYSLGLTTPARIRLKDRVVQVCITQFYDAQS
jgi:hypothetical protein